MKPVKQIFILFQVCFCTSLSFSQDSIAIFKVVKSKTSYTISPSNNVLWIGADNRICITAQGEGTIAKVELTGGTITKKDSCYIVQVTSGGGHEAILSVYESLPGGKLQLVANKKYNIVTMPLPEVLVCNVKNDSTIDKFSLMAIGRLTAKLKGTNEKLQVVSFEMQTAGQSTIDTLKANNEKLTVPMKRVIDTMKPGSLILFNNIICRNANGNLLAPLNVRIFLDEKTIYQYGF